MMKLKIQLQHPHAGNRGWEIAFEPGLEQVCQNVTEANARRLVACWNACEGISTKALEVVIGMGASVGDKIAALEASERELMGRRDELMTAIGACRDAMPETAVQVNDAIAYPLAVPDYVRASVSLLVAQRDELLEALTEIKNRIEDHPMYAPLTMEEECEVGGDTAELSYLVRVADEALKGTA